MCFIKVLLAVFSLGLAGKCDKYIVGAVHIHKGSTADEGSAPIESYQGCRKGCFYNYTVDDFGVKKCEKCSAIEDEQFCKKQPKCNWAKGGKCKSASCAQLGRYFFDTPVTSEEFIKLIEGDEKTKLINDKYLEYRVGGYSGPDSRQYLYPHSPADSNLADYKKKLCDLRTNSSNSNEIADCWNSIFNDASIPCSVSDGLLGLVFDYNPANGDGWKINYYGTAAAATARTIQDIKDKCLKDYESSVAGVYNTNGVTGIATNHVGEKARRKECHVISGCMYSRTYSRCSIWAVWAFILCLVLAIFVFLVIVAVLCFILLGKLGGKGKKVGAVESSAEDGNKDSAPAQTMRPVEYAPVESAPVESTSVESVPIESTPAASAPLEESESSEKSQ